ncbi:MAG TPA: OsmC family peroxiredoxin, partial [Burkholderiaceae bacterium]
MAHVHTALVRWHVGSDDFLGKRYSRAHTWTFDGGAVVPGSSS